MSLVLVVDDDSGNRRVLASRLAEQGHEVVSGENGALGLSHARESRFDVVLVSSELRAGVDGFEVCRRVKALPERARPGIVLFSEQSPLPEVLQRGYQAGCDAFLTRPDLPTLEAVLANLLRQRKRVSELENELARVSQGRRANDVRASSPADSTSKDAGDRAGALREFACGTPEAVLLVDSEGMVRHADRGACEMLGGRIEGKHLGSLAPASGLEAFARDARLEACEGYRFDLAARKGHASRALSATVVPLVAQAARHDPEMRVVLLHDAARRRVAAEVLRVQEPGIPRQELGPLLEAAREAWRPEGLVGESPAIVAVRRALPALSHSTVPVLLRGEAGSGKERVARILHYSGAATGAFVQLRCGALTPEDLELELFGRAKGTSPDALPDRPGLFHIAQDGTLYLAEIGDAPAETQAKILRFLEEGVITRVGSRRSEKADVRLIASSEASLEGRVREGRFSKELLQRLEPATLVLPSLGERGDDVLPLARHYLERIGSPRGLLGFSQPALGALRGYAWPGNVPELVEAIHEACAHCGGDTIGLENLPRSLRDHRHEVIDEVVIPSMPPGRTPQPGTHAISVPEREIAPRPAPARELRAWDITDDDPISLELYEKKALLRALDRVGGDRLAAAKLLNVGKSTLYRKLKQFGI